MKITIRALLLTKWDMKINSCHNAKVHKRKQSLTNVKSDELLLAFEFFHTLTT